MNTYEAIGQRIILERKKLSITREKLAELLGLSAYFVGQIERGARKMSFDTLVKVADCLHISLDYLVRGAETTGTNDELTQLINKCSPQEKALLVDVLKSALPHLRLLNK